MRKLLSVFFVALLVVQAGGITGFAFDEDCEQECAESDADSAPPPCAFCHCCFASNVFVPAAALSVDFDAYVRGIQAPADFLPSLLIAADISHVPKHLLG